MTAHFATTRAQKDAADLLRRDPFLRAIYRADSLADLTAIIQQFGITDPEHRAAMLGLAKLAWIVLRRLD